jgi:multidrug resistance efflux pump
LTEYWPKQRPYWPKQRPNLRWHRRPAIQQQVTYKRYQNLFKGKVISAQDFDTAADIYGGNQAVVTAEQSNVDGLEALEAFKIIRAPFDGTIAARNTDIGAYVLAGSGTPLFRMAATSRLRVTSPFHKRFLR